MTPLPRALLAITLVVAGLFAAWRVIVITQADRWAEEAPPRALRWAPDHPVALLALAERQLADGQHEQAVASARRLVAVEPLEGRGFRVLAEAAHQSGDASQALALYTIAARRSPRDIAARAWLTQHHLDNGDFRAALEQIDKILRIAPKQQATLLPILAQLARDPKFAEELARSLQQRPQWRERFLTVLQKQGDAPATQRVMSALQQEGGLSDAEFDRWIDQLIAQGRWGEAYSRWAGTLATRGLRLTPVYNGQFETDPSSRGFDWRVTRIPGVGVEFVTDSGAAGRVAHLSFRSRPVPRANIEQPLLLAPGDYELRMNIRADALRSDRGLEWVVLCAGVAAPIAASERLGGTFARRSLVTGFTVPSSGCAGQWLQLRNPAPTGSAQFVSGDVWVDDVTVTPAVSPSNRE